MNTLHGQFPDPIYHPVGPSSYRTVALCFAGVSRTVGWHLHLKKNWTPGLELLFRLGYRPPGAIYPLRTAGLVAEVLSTCPVLVYIKIFFLLPLHKLMPNVL